MLCGLEKQANKQKLCFVKSHIPIVRWASPIFLHRDNWQQMNSGATSSKPPARTRCDSRKSLPWNTVRRTPKSLPLNSSLLASITPLPKCLQKFCTQSFSEQLAGYHEFPNSIQNIIHFPWFQHKEASQCRGKGFGIRCTWVPILDLRQVTWFLWVRISSSFRQLVRFMKAIRSEWHIVGLLYWFSTSLTTFFPFVPQEVGFFETFLKRELEIMKNTTFPHKKSALCSFPYLSRLVAFPWLSSIPFQALLEKAQGIHLMV